MELAKYKKRLYENRLNSLQNTLHLTKTDIIPMVCHCLPIAFENVKNNRKAIVEKGWYPYNKVLLLDTTLK